MRNLGFPLAKAPARARRVVSALMAAVLVAGLCIPAVPPGTATAFAADWKFKAYTGTTEMTYDSDFDKYWGSSEPDEGSMSAYQYKSIDGLPIWCAHDSMSTNMPVGTKITSVDPVAKGIWDQSVVTDLALTWYYIYETGLYRTPSGKKLSTAKEKYAAMGVMQWGILRDADIADGRSGRYTDYYGSRKMSVNGNDVTGWNNTKWSPNGPWTDLKAWLKENRSKYIGHAHYFDFGRSGAQNVAGMYEVELLSGAIGLTKSSSDASVTDGNAYYSLKGARYGVYATSAKAATHSADAAIKVYETDRDGAFETEMDYDPGVTYYVAEVQASPGYKLDEGVHAVKVEPRATTRLSVVEQPALGGIRLAKSAALPALSAGNGNYSLSGAVYGVFATEARAKSHDAAQAEKTFATDGSGTWRSSLEFPPGTYYVSEVSASAGYLRDDAVYPVKVEADALAAVNGDAGVKEQERYAVVDLLLQKLDADAGDAAQGDATRAGAEFTVSFYAGYHGAGSLPASATRTWVVRADDGGKVDWRHPDKVSGDDFFRNANGEVVMPLGTVSMVESKAPRGYNLQSPGKAPTVYVMQVKPDDSRQGGAAVIPLNYQAGSQGASAASVPDVVQRGDFRLVKEASVEIGGDAPQEARRILVPGIQFQIVNDSAQPVISPEDGTTSVAPGGVVCTVTTDENGLADTRAVRANGWSVPAGWTGALAYGTYSVHEVVPEAVGKSFSDEYGTKLIPADDWKVTISSEGQRDPSTLVNNRVPQSALRVTKVDAETGKRIPAPAAFQIYDRHGDLVTYTSHYPEEQTIDTFIANERGEVTLPMLLPGGTYTLREAQAPEGYVLSNASVSFTVDGYNSWDDPIQVEFEDMPIKGVVQLQKLDAETGEAVAGAVYVVAAAEDITTPDGTVRMEEGGTAAIVSLDAEGRAATGELYLGNYRVYEAKSPNGYALDTDEHDVAVASEGQDVPVVTVAATFEDAPSTLRVKKVDAETGEALPGAEFRIWQDPVERAATADGDGAPDAGDADGSGGEGGNGGEGGDDGDDAPDAGDGGADDAPAAGAAGGDARAIAADPFDMRVITGEDGTVGFSHLPRGLYHVAETAAPAGYHLPDEVETVDVTVDGQGFVGVGGQVFGPTFELTVDNQPNAIGTEARVDGSHVAQARGVVTLLDTVTYRGCTVGAEYTVSGVLHRAVVAEDGSKADGGEVLDASGNAISAKTTFTAQEREGSVEVAFVFDASDLAGCSVVAFEEMTCGDDLFAVHADIEDADQAVFFEPEVATTLVDEATGNHTARVGDAVILIDTVRYRGLAPGHEYRAQGSLVYKSSQDPVVNADGSPVRAEVAFVPEEPDGTVEIQFAFDSRDLADVDVVAFEQLYEGDVLIATHEDAGDREQTVSFPDARTFASDADDGDKVVDADGRARIVDTVTYRGLAPGVEYVVEGELHYVSGQIGARLDGGAVRDRSGKSVRASATFTPERPGGTVDVVFTLDAGKLDGREVVVFERVKQPVGEGKAITVVVHEDVNDADQGVAFRSPADGGGPSPSTPAKPGKTVVKTAPGPNGSSSGGSPGSGLPKTGDVLRVLAAVLLAAGAVSAGAIAIMRRRAR